MKRGVFITVALRLVNFKFDDGTKQPAQIPSVGKSRYTWWLADHEGMEE